MAVRRGNGGDTMAHELYFAEAEPWGGVGGGFYLHRGITCYISV